MPFYCFFLNNVDALENKIVPPKALLISYFLHCFLSWIFFIARAFFTCLKGTLRVSLIPKPTVYLQINPSISMMFITHHILNFSQE